VELGDTIDNCISTLPEKCGVTYMVNEISIRRDGEHELVEQNTFISQGT
jgi:hypothetical protein